MASSLVGFNPMSWPRAVKFTGLALRPVSPNAVNSASDRPAALAAAAGETLLMAQALRVMSPM
jgi:hypothetical protein